MAAYLPWAPAKRLRVSASTSAPSSLLKGTQREGKLDFSKDGTNGSSQLCSNLPEEPASLVSLLRLHGKHKSLSAGKLLHAHIITSSYEHHILLANCLIGMYGACGSLHDAQHVFDRLPSPNVFSWNLLLHAYGRHASLADVRALFERIPHPDVCSWNTLIKLVSQHGCLDDTRVVFGRMPHRNVVSWNAMIAASSRPIKYCQDALFYFLQMQLEGVLPDKFTFVCVIDACMALRSLDIGKIVHVLSISVGSKGDPMVGTALINMYDKCGTTLDAFNVFKRIPCPDAIALTAMMASFSHNEQGEEALDLFHLMLQKGMRPDVISYVCALDACASLSTLEEGREMHSAVVHMDLGKNPVIETALVNMYGKGGSLFDANSIFCNMSFYDAIPWTVMIGVLAENQEHERALSLFYQMYFRGFCPDEVTFICILDVCAGLAAIDEGRIIYSAIIEKALEENVVVGNNIVNLHGKCGCLVDSRRVFDRLPIRNTLTWNIMLGACASVGNYLDTLLLFNEMKCEGKQVDEITCLCILMACSHAGLVEFGRYVFASIPLCHGVIYIRDHYVCMVDLLGRAGHLEEAEAFIESIPFAYFPMLWLCLLGACKTHGDIERGARAGKWCYDLDPTDPAACVVLLNMYS
ncbi:hypothetical protein GOP47_0006775 [Adiantum capillus-veneris]|uniref:Pentatricopeptide repeat-containing protein n=1 Tax=Adiantum capillus-veneris TaxID=13818 RepID=A0A9D4ZKR5_ADICA|nr:hypothetical protein GOP47_0006775 [Adiantum capillus-veneris]